MSLLDSFLQGSDKAINRIEKKQKLSEFLQNAPSRMENTQLDTGLKKQRFEQGKIISEQSRLSSGLQKSALINRTIDHMMKMTQDPQERQFFAQKLQNELKNVGVDFDISNLTVEDFDDEGLMRQKSILGAAAQVAKAGSQPADVEKFKFFNSVIQDPNATPEEKKAAGISLGTVAREGTKGFDERILDRQGDLDQIAQNRRKLEREETLGTEEAKLTGETIKTANDKIGKVQGNIANIDKAINLLKNGAQTGSVAGLLPNVTNATRQLKQLQNELALDIVGSVTLGAISKPELDLVLDTALDLSQDESALIEDLEKRSAAQKKIVDYLEQQIQFLDAGGTVPEWREFINNQAEATKNRSNNQATNQAQPQQQQQQQQQQRTFTSSSGIQFTVN